MGFIINGFLGAAKSGFQIFSNDARGPSSRVITAIAVGTVGLLGSWLLYRRMEASRQLRTLDPSDSQLRDTPGPRNTLQPRTLDLSNGRLTDALDLRNNPQLKYLYLSNNQLRAPPDVSQNFQLCKIDFSRNQLRDPPDLRGNLQLISLDLCQNQFSEAPELSRLSQLNYLDLSHNHLRNAPDLRVNLQLSYLGLSHNRLREAPDLSGNPQLKDLNLSHNQLSDAPDLRANPQLNYLDLSHNLLSNAPELGGNLQLKYLGLAHNRLREAPDLRGNLYLSDLDFSHNLLSEAPELSGLSQLRCLDLSHNRLREAPELRGNSRLENIDLTGNQLTALPDSILTLPRGSAVRAENNMFSAEYVAQFQQRLEQHRLQHPNQGPTVFFSIYEESSSDGEFGALDEELATWSTEFETAFPQSSNAELWGSRPTIDLENHRECFGPLLSLDDAPMLANYLTRLRRIADYRAGGQPQKNIILKVEQILQLACRNEQFRKNMLALIREGLVACNDLVLTSLNDIEIQAQFDREELSLEQFRKLAIGAQRYELLKDHVALVAHERQLGDEVETFLFYQIHLKDALDLPISTEGMLYPLCAGKISPEDIEAAKQKILAVPEEEVLAHSRYWGERMKQLNASEVDRLNEHYYGLIACAGEYFGETNPEKREELLRANPSLAEIIQNPQRSGVGSYEAVAAFIAAERERAIARLGR